MLVGLDARAIEKMEADRAKLLYYSKALFHLVTHDQRWVSNYNLYMRWDDAKRLWWIDIMEKQAAEGKSVLATTLQSTALMIRMTK
jgi:hypothetical protein